MVKSGRAENLLDVLTQSEILEFCRLGLNRRKFYRTKTWDTRQKTKYQPIANLLRICAKSEKYRYLIHILPLCRIPLYALSLHGPDGSVNLVLELILLISIPVTFLFN